MRERENLIINFLKSDEYVPMKAKEISSLLLVPKEKYDEFIDVLNDLEDRYIIRKNRKNKYILMDEKYIQGMYRGHEKGYGFVIPDDKELSDIYIPKGSSKNALNGDTVLIKITRDESEGYRKEGEVVKVIKHEKESVVGVFKNNRNFGFVVPDDKKLGTDIYISKKKFNGAKDNQKVVVRILEFPINGKNAEGEIVEVLGDRNEAGIDMLSLIKEYNLLYEFPKPVLDEAEKIEYKIEQKDISNRVDLRNKNIFTIDGDDAKDLDDAVWVCKNEKGNYILDVHIADVSHYVKEGSKINDEAIARGKSIYMFDRVIPMLPEVLSNGICSLNAGEDRYTLSLTAEIDPKGKVVSSDIYKAIINVKERMTYTNVQKIIDQEDDKILEKYKEYINDFKLMEELAYILKNKRLEEGSLNLDIPECKIILDEKGIAIDVKKYELSFANEIIEQFMLTANEIVAERFFWLEAPFIYRVHETPDIDKVLELNKFLFGFGYTVKANKDQMHPKAFSEVLEKSKGTEEEKIISNLMLHTLKVARYENDNKGHFGLSSKYYCHFTSPIRRYPDLFIHRIISKYIEKQYNMDEKEKSIYFKQSKEYAESSSKREGIAQKVERESLDIKKAEYMSSKIGEEYEGIISNVTSFGIFVELENTVEGLIRFENLGNEYFIYDDEHKQLIGEKTNVIYKIGEKINIRVIEANKDLRRISFEKM